MRAAAAVPQAIRPEYDRLGPEGYYRAHGADYRNPHEAIVRTLILGRFAEAPPGPGSILDLACGSGEATLALRAAGAADVVGADPFTGDAYKARTGSDALRLRFEDICDGALVEHRFSLVVCSFAMHLLPESRLPVLLPMLAQAAPRLWILTPHKRPAILPSHGWRLDAEILRDRVRLRDYGARGATAGGER